MGDINDMARPAEQALAVPVEPASSLAASRFDPSRCMDCGNANPVWFASNEVWNRVIGDPDAKDDPGGFYCPSCFIARAEAIGVCVTWEVRPHVA